MASAKGEIEDGHRSGLRRLTHLMVLGTAVLPMSVTFAFAHPADAGRTRLGLQEPRSALAEVTTLGRGGAALAEVNAPDPAPPPPPPALIAPPPPPPPPPPVAGGVGLHFPWGYCTWYVSTRRLIPWSGNAGAWYGAAAAMGYKVGSTPAAGAIMVSREGPVGHVAFVESVDGSGFTVSEMNFNGYGIVDQRRIQLGSVSLYGFIY